MGRTTEGIREETLVPWLETHVAGLRPPLDFSLIAGGRSNLTYRVEDAAGHRYVLRRPPLGQVLATAHDMGREHRIISALGPTAVPVPRALAACDDPGVNGAPFYVMEFVDGHIVRDSRAAEGLLDVAQRRHASESLIEVLAEIHAVDPAAVGLGDLGRQEGYLERQLRRWHGQLQHASSPPPELEQIHHRLSARVPEQGPAAIVHGDYRLDNCMLGPDGTVQAVLDWELCTLGDPLADLGLLLVYWAEPSDGSVEDSLVGSPTIVEGFLRRDQVAERYASLTGRDVSDIGYYVAFGRWKLACILQGVLDRYRGGAMGDDGTDADSFAGRIDHLAGSATAALDAPP